MTPRLTESHCEQNYGGAVESTEQDRGGARVARCRDVDNRAIRTPRLWLNMEGAMHPFTILEWMLHTVRVWRFLKRTRRQLAELDDRQLRDVGLTRGQALGEHSKPFWKL
jgi:uncharacterized protein YjiS (DUF1127 family)